MKLPITCNECKFKSPHADIYVEEIEIRDDFLYKITCPNGHESITLLTQQRYEILFEIGAYAVIDGYYREAISSFTSSLERYYEFFVKTILISQSVRSDEIDKSWKNVSSQSERQLGGYVFTHLLVFGVVPSLMDNKLIKLRNEVIHKGKIPSKNESIEYGEKTLALIREGVSRLQANHNNAVREMIRQSICGPDNENGKVGTMTVPTILNLIVSDNDYHNRSLRDAIEDIRNHRLM